MSVTLPVYLDTSVLVGMFVKDVFSERSTRVVAEADGGLVVSDFAVAELASAIARRVRTKHLTVDEARGAFADVDHWLPRNTEPITVRAADVAQAAIHIRRLDLSLRTPDALHLAITARAGARLATFDTGMASAAHALGLASVES